MKSAYFNFVYCVLLAYLVRKALSADDTSYRAAVVEYHPIQSTDFSIDERTSANVQVYKDLITTSGEQDLDIVVYPEWGITHGIFGTRENLLEASVVVPYQSEEIVPCDDESYPQFFRTLSCFANQISAYIVVNLLEKEKCVSDCASDDWNMYNTDVVFDRTGKVIQRYRKFNPFGEAEMNITEEAEVATFETDFGVTFGMFTCFDILFEKPALELVRKDVKHIIFPSMWFSELPFLTSLQSQLMFAVENDVVLLASGANSASSGSGGTGIYQGKLGAISYDIVSNDGSKVIVANVSKTWDSNTILSEEVSTNDDEIDEIALAMDAFYLKHDNLTLYKGYRMSSQEYSGTFENGELSCRVSWKISSQNIPEDHYDYVFFYFSGVRTFDHVRDGAVDVCALVSCQKLSEDEENFDNCGVRYSSYSDIAWTHTIEELTISANFTVSNSSIQFPNTLASNIRPLDRSDYQWTSRYFDDGKIVEKTITLLKPQDRLMTFGIYGRDFARDNSANPISKANVVLAMLVSFVVLLS